MRSSRRSGRTSRPGTVRCGRLGCCTSLLYSTVANRPATYALRVLSRRLVAVVVLVDLPSASLDWHRLADSGGDDILDVTVVLAEESSYRITRR
jgi:hypothetical protein